MNDLCDSVVAAHQLSHYAYGDPLPVYARYFASDGEAVKKNDAAVLYVQCQREKGHDGKHMAFGQEPWN